MILFCWNMEVPCPAIGLSNGHWNSSGWLGWYGVSQLAMFDDTGGKLSLERHGFGESALVAVVAAADHQVEDRKNSFGQTF